jgi:hypothetical protein
MNTIPQNSPSEQPQEKNHQAAIGHLTDLVPQTELQPGDIELPDDPDEVYQILLMLFQGGHLAESSAALFESIQNTVSGADSASLASSNRLD